MKLPSIRHLPARIAALALLSALAAPWAAAQQGGQAKPAARPATGGAAAKAPVRSATGARTAARSPIAALETRGANPAGPFARLTETQRDSIVENTRSLLGIRYKWAGATPERGVDCSGLVRYVFARLGIDVPHSSVMLARLGGAVAKDTSEMQPGDLLVFSKTQTKRISHVGIYVGDGMMVHASSTSKQVVETPVMEYKGLTLRGVRRVFSVDSTAMQPIVYQ